MKTLSLSLLFFSQIALAFTPGNAGLIQDFMSLLNDTMVESDGDVERLDCGDNVNGEGILCLADLKFIDTVANGASQGGGEERCTEVYTYNKTDGLNTICSTCEYSKSYGNHQKSCSIEQTKKETGKYLDELVELLKADTKTILSFETPIYMGTFEDYIDQGVIDSYEVYKLNYTVFEFDENLNHPGYVAPTFEVVSKCEYVTFDYALNHYTLTGVTCDNPWTDVIDENLIDEA